MNASLFVRRLARVSCGLFVLCCTAPAAAPAAQHLVARPAQQRVSAASASGAFYLYNLDYSNGTIEAYRVANGAATLERSWRVVDPKKGGLGGLAVDRYGLAYVGVDSSTGRPCPSCVEVFEPDGTLLARVKAPILSGAPNPPDITDVAVDDAGDVFASDIGQQAVYEYLPTPYGFAPQIVVEDSNNAASVAVSPDARLLFISGGCGFAAVRLYLISDSGGYVAQNCFNIGTIALIGGAVDDRGDVFTPVDGAIGLVAISDANGRGSAFRVPGRLAEIGGVALSHDGKLLYVSDHRHEQVFVYARPTEGWFSKSKPQLVARYRGFAKLDIIAVSG